MAVICRDNGGPREVVFSRHRIEEVPGLVEVAGRGIGLDQGVVGAEVSCWHFVEQLAREGKGTAS